MPQVGDRGAIILAGGDSKRLGVPKPVLELDGITLIERAVTGLSQSFNRITVVTDRPELFPALPVQYASDLLTGCAKNPLRGIHAGLSASGLTHQFVMACDMPFLNLTLINYMAQFASDYDVVVPRVGSYYQPLYAFYSRACLEPIRKQVEQGGGKVTTFYASIRVRYIERAEIIKFDPLERSFFNINTWADYEAAERLLSGLRHRGN
jgi:molybdenum cofactor guanylyltransferase